MRLNTSAERILSNEQTNRVIEINFDFISRLLKFCSRAVVEIE